MSDFKVGDKVVLNCTKEEFFDKVVCGSSIYESCFVDGVATIRTDNGYDGGFYLTHITSNTGGFLHKSELKYIKLYEETPKEVNKFTNNTELLNKILSNTFPEIDGSFASRYLHVQGTSLCKWVDDDTTSSGVKLKIIRACTPKELAIWDAYAALVEAIHMEDAEDTLTLHTNTDNKAIH